MTVWSVAQSKNHAHVQLLLYLMGCPERVLCIHAEDIPFVPNMTKLGNWAIRQAHRGVIFPRISTTVPRGRLPWLEIVQNIPYSSFSYVEHCSKLAVVHTGMLMKVDRLPIMLREAFRRHDRHNSAQQIHEKGQELGNGMAQAP